MAQLKGTSIDGVLNVLDDVQVDSTILWDSSNNWVPQAILENDSITVNGTDVSLGESVTVDTFSGSYDDLTDVPSSFTPEIHGNEAHDSTFATETYVDDNASSPTGDDRAIQFNDNGEFSGDTTHTAYVDEPTLGQVSLGIGSGNGDLEFYHIGDQGFMRTTGTVPLTISSDDSVTIQDLVEPTNDSDAATKLYVDTETFSGSYTDLIDVPSTFTPESHGNEAHDETYITEAPEMVAYETGYSAWGSGLTEEEVHSFENPNNNFLLKKLEMQVKGRESADAELSASPETLGVPGTLIETISRGDWVYSVDLNDEYIVLGTLDTINKTIIYNTGDWSIEETLSNQSGSRTETVALGDGLLAHGGQDDNVYIHNTNDFNLEETLEDATGAVYDVEFSDDEDYLAVASSDNNVYVYDTSDFSLLETLTDATGRVESVAWSNDGSYLASSDGFGGDDNVYVYDVSDFSLQETLTESTDYVDAVAFGEGFIAYGGEDENLYVHNTVDWSLEQTLTDATTSIQSVDFRDGYIVHSDSSAFGSGGSAYIHNTSDWSLEKTLSDAEGTVSEVVFGETYLAYSSFDENAYVYDREVSEESVSVSAGEADGTETVIEDDPVRIRLTTNEEVDATLIVRGELR